MSERDHTTAETLVPIFDDIRTEVLRAAAKHRPMSSHHEAYSVIKEEFDEYWAEVCKGGGTPRDPIQLRAELIQTAAMCVRALADLCR